jgi:hypothetical protein
MKKIKFELNAYGTYEKIEDLMAFPTPIPAQEDIPRWWLDGESFLNKDDMSLSIKDKASRIGGMKSCIPFLDSLTSGYLIRLWRSVEVYFDEENNLAFRQVIKNSDGVWVEDLSNSSYKSIGERGGDLGHTMPRPAGYDFTHLAWASPWGTETPKGWSVLVSHPFNRYDLPFITSSAIMDSDRFMANGNFPFYIKKGWTGIIEAGTPIAQFIPIKRTSWMGFAKIGLSEKSTYYANSARAVSYGYYRSKRWVKKVYEMSKGGNK